MEFSEQMVADVLADFFDRCETIKAAGGIAYRDIVEGTRIPPADWILDRETDYYVPPGLMLGRWR